VADGKDRRAAPRRGEKRRLLTERDHLSQTGPASTAGRDQRPAEPNRTKHPDAAAWTLTETRLQLFIRKNAISTYIRRFVAIPSGGAAQHEAPKVTLPKVTVQLLSFIDICRPELSGIRLIDNRHFGFMIH